VVPIATLAARSVMLLLYMFVPRVSIASRCLVPNVDPLQVPTDPLERARSPGNVD